MSCFKEVEVCNKTTGEEYTFVILVDEETNKQITTRTEPKLDKLFNLQGSNNVTSRRRNKKVQIF